MNPLMPRKAAQDAPQGTPPDAGLPKALPAPKTPQKAKFRLSAPRALESDIQTQIVDYLRAQQARGRIVWFARCNGGSVLSMHKGRRSFTRFYALYLRGAEPAHKGMADLHGMLPDGRYFALEVKRPGERATPEQQAFLAAVQAGGGLAEVVHGFEEVANVLWEESDESDAGI